MPCLIVKGPFPDISADMVEFDQFIYLTSSYTRFFLCYSRKLHLNWSSGTWNPNLTMPNKSIIDSIRCFWTQWKCMMTETSSIYQAADSVILPKVAPPSFPLLLPSSSYLQGQTRRQHQQSPSIPRNYNHTYNGGRRPTARVAVSNSIVLRW